MTGSDSISRRAFSLIELLVVISIIALLVSILLPALSGARLAAQRVVSLANLDSLAEVHATYAADSRDIFLNPFNKDMGRLFPNTTVGGLPVSFATIWLPEFAQSSGTRLGIDLSSTTRNTEPFSAVWGSFLLHYLQNAGQMQKYLMDPADPVIAERTRRMNVSTDDVDMRIYDTSYWYPPVFWLGAERYASESFQSMTTSLTAANGAKYLRHNHFADVPFPTQKALLFERFDWSVRRRPSGVGKDTVDAPPQWNNPVARPQTAFVDGSATAIKMTGLHALGESSDSRVTQAFRPNGYFNPSSGYTRFFLTDPSLGEQEQYETGLSPFTNTTAWRQYFYATRNGIKGRDITTR